MQKKEKEIEIVKNSVNDARRDFLKRAAYAAPTVVALGALTKPTESEAGSLGKPPSAPTWN